jgi:predicted lipoprotein with Yx(FWY)xxD motif
LKHLVVASLMAPHRPTPASRRPRTPRHLTDNSGRSLYLFTRDEGGNSACSDNCARNWPPVRTIGAPAAGEGATASLLGTITRPDGSAQVTYGGKPLYYFATDEKPGDTKGQNVANAWYVVSASGEAIRTTP